MKIKMVIGLVQQKDVRVFEQKPCNIYFCFLTAGQKLEGALPHGTVYLEPVSDLISFKIGVISVSGLEPRKKPVIFV